MILERARWRRPASMRHARLRSYVAALNTGQYAATVPWRSVSSVGFVASVAGLPQSRGDDVTGVGVPRGAILVPAATPPRASRRPGHDRTQGDRGPPRAGRGRPVPLAHPQQWHRRQCLELPGAGPRRRLRVRRPRASRGRPPGHAAGAEGGSAHGALPPARRLALPPRVRRRGLAARRRRGRRRRARRPLRGGRRAPRRPPGDAHPGARVAALLVPARRRPRGALLLGPRDAAGQQGAALRALRVPRGSGGLDAAQRRASPRPAVRYRLPGPRGAAHRRPEGGAAGAARADLSGPQPVSYTHLRAHETRHDLVCRLLLEKKKKKNTYKVVDDT